MGNFSLVIHGGAGTIVKEDMTTALEHAYLDALDAALQAGKNILAANGTAQDAVIAAVCVLEDSPLFNAGKGSVFTKTGTHEMDASIMLGHTLAAGACAGVKHVQNPVKLAAAIMENSEHVMLAGDGAMQFALDQKMNLQPDSYFYSQFRYDQWKAVRDTNTYALDHNISGIEHLMKDKKFGTVGAVACDVMGNLAAATSTGGMTNKQYSRIGDTPIIGAGCYANNRTCAISATGHGELFIKAVAAYDVSCLMEYRGLTLQQAMELVVMEKLVKIGGEGGLIGVDGYGNTAMVFNSAGMYRGALHSNGLHELAIYQ
jgi:L-asparaginase / beta-aspartyl-peptidase